MFKYSIKRTLLYLTPMSDKIVIVKEFSGEAAIDQIAATCGIFLCDRKLLLRSGS